MSDDGFNDSEFVRQIGPHLLRGLEEMSATRATSVSKITEADAAEIRRRTRELIDALKGRRGDDAC